MCVNRGKMSEGIGISYIKNINIDFTDKLCRAVFMVGVPFLPVFDKKVEAKKNYLNWMSS
jgi:Rad3-related DNA helicase